MGRPNRPGGQLLGRSLLWCLTGVLVFVTGACSSTSAATPAATPPPTSHPVAYWSVQTLTSNYPIEKIEVAGTHEAIGYALGQWYRDRGHLPRPLTTNEQEMAGAMIVFYEEVHPSIGKQLQGVDDVSDGIPVWDDEGIRILLPGLVERHSCSVIATRPELAADGHARLGRNHDWPTALTDVLIVFTAPEDGYPTVVMTRGLPGFTASDGMNGEGLALGLASVRNVGYESPAEPALVSTAAYRLVLEQSANVEEAIAMLHRTPVSFVNPSPDEAISHILLADRSGASAVVEFLPEGIVVSQTDTPY
jgi:hypothetical protein